MEIVVTRLHKLDGAGITKAFVDIALDDELVINGLRVVEGKDGLFVAMPREEGKDGKWYNTVIPLSRAVKDKIEHLVMEVYEGDVIPTQIEPDGIWIPTKEIRNGCGDTEKKDV